MCSCIDADGLVCVPYPTCYAPFVVVRLAEGIDLFLRDVATVEALAAVVAEARAGVAGDRSRPGWRGLLGRMVA